MSLSSILKNRKNRRITNLLIEHAGMCVAVGNSLHKASAMMKSGSLSDLKSRVSVIRTEERSADEVEAKINREVAKSSLPSKLAEELLLFVRALDRAAGAAKRTVINLELISEYPMPKKYSNLINEATSILKEIFEIMEKTLHRLDDSTFVTKQCRKVGNRETKIDEIYVKLKKGYFEIEKTFNSAAAMIILDHAFRDIEAVADFSEDATEVLTTLVSRRG